MGCWDAEAESSKLRIQLSYRSEASPSLSFGVQGGRGCSRARRAGGPGICHNVPVQTQDLSGDGWTVRAVGDLSGVPEQVRGRVFPARVPGCVHLDLIRAGVLRHPNMGYAEREQEWVGRTDWRYERGFEWTGGALETPLLCLDRVDTQATVELNGEFVGRVSNAFTLDSLQLPRGPRDGDNMLAITISAPVPLAEAEHRRLGRLPHNGDELGWTPFQMVRKPACNFGWDWGPRVATSGIAGGVWITSDRQSVGVVRGPLLTHLGDNTWQIEVALCPREPRGSLPVSMRLSRDSGDIPVGTSDCEQTDDGWVRCRVRVQDPDLWWPRGHGPQHMYRLDMSFGDGLESHRSWRIGFRTVRLDSAPDERGSAFALRVNGRPIFCRGANWIPDQLFPTEATPRTVRDRVRQAADANMNMLRVWGGGFYEQAAFYEACDELGVMVWQDFMFACALYPEWALRLDREYEQQVRRLCPHPSVVLWCGGNECAEGYQHWGWRERLKPGLDWGDLLWDEVLRGIVEHNDPSRPYWPNSPWSGRTEPTATRPDLRHPRPGRPCDVRDPDHGDRHTWDLHFEDVRKIVPRFVSEFGRVAPACERTLGEAGVFDDMGTPAGVPNGAPRASEGSWGGGRSRVPSLARGALRDAPPRNEQVRDALEHRLRQTGGSGVAYDPVLPEHFARPAADLRGWLWQTQALQARALTTHIEWLRANSPRCMGALVWQLNDCWACQSWSLIDSAGRPKPAWYAVRRAFEPRLLTVQPLGSESTPPGQGRGRSSPRAEPLSAVLVNDTDEPFEGECLVRRVSFTGIELAAATAHIQAAVRSVGRIDALLGLVGEPDDRSAEALVVECGGRRSVWFWGRDRELHLPGSPLVAAIVEREGRVFVRLEARALARDVILAADLFGERARAADNCFTLLAGETREVEIAGSGLDIGIGVNQAVRCASGPAE